MTRTTEVIDLRTPSRERRARNLLELVFLFTLRPCRACGLHDPDLDFRKEVGGTLAKYPDTAEYTVSRRCSHCRCWRQIIAHTVPDPDVPISPTDLGGEGPSQIIPPEEFLAEVQRLLPLIAETPSTLPYKPWKVASDALHQATTCANELARFPLVDGDGPMGRAAVTQLQARLGELTARYDADTERSAAEQTAAEGRKVPIGDLQREALEAHDQWIRRHQSGEGQLVLKHRIFRGRQIPPVPSSRWEDVRLVDVDASLIPFEDVEMRQITWEESRLRMCRFERAWLTNARFFECDMTGARLYSMHLEEGLFDECYLQGALWTGARCDRVTFKYCRLLDTCFDDAVFTRCDFREQMLGGTKELARFATTKNARFEDCDFRNTDWLGRDLSYATFVRCRFEGAVGRPTAAEGLTLIDCDVDARRLLKMLKG